MTVVHFCVSIPDAHCGHVEVSIEWYPWKCGMRLVAHMPEHRWAVGSELCAAGSAGCSMRKAVSGLHAGASHGSTKWVSGSV